MLPVLLIVLFQLGLAAAVYIGWRQQKALKLAGQRIAELGSARQDQAASLRDSRELFSSSNDLLFAVDPAGFFLVANPRFEEVLGYSHREAGGKTLPDLLRSDFRPFWDEMIAAAEKAERVPYLDLVLIDREGNEVAVVGACWPRFVDGVFTELRGVLVDVTAQRRAQEEVVLGEERFRNLFEGAPYPLWVYDGASLRLKEVNAAALACYGYSREQMLLLSLSDLYADEEADRLRAFLAGPRQPQEQEGVWRHRLGDGRVIDVDIASNAIDFGGRDARLVFARDVTHHLRTQEALQESERRYRSLFENSQGLLCSHELDGRMLAVNPAAAHQLGYEPEEMVGRFLQEFLAPGVAGRFDAYLAAVAAQGKASGLMRILARDGGERVWMYSNALLEKAGAPAYVLGHAADVTDRLRLEAEKQMYLDRIEHQNLDLELRNREVERANRLKSEFLATMSHELRTPLNAIIGFSDLLDEEEVGRLNEAQKSYLSFVRKGARHLLRLINDVLDLSKIEAGKIDLALESLRAHEPVLEVLATLEPLFLAKKLHVESAVAEDLSVLADRVRLKQVLFNLLSNAIKFTPVGGSINLATRAEDGKVVFSVRDSGCGIAEDDQEEIFSEFHQVTSTARRTREGTGLGLSIGRRLVELHGGRIWVESAPGEGSTFFFSLPVARPDEPVSPLPAVRAGPRSHPLALVVETDAAAQELWGSHLRSAGYEPVFVTSGIEALSKARSLKPEVITLEVAVERERGWQLLEELKQSSETSGIPVVVVSVVDEKRRALALGAADCLTKPVSREQFLASVKRFIPSLQAPADTVLVVDDQSETNLRLSDAVLAAGFRPLAAKTGREAMRILSDVRPGALLINLDLPDMDGFQTIVRLRADPVFHELPILALVPDDAPLDDLALLEGNTCLISRLDAPWKEAIGDELRRLLGQVKKE